MSVATYRGTRRRRRVHQYEQIAEALGAPIEAVRSRLHRARGVLREALAPAGLLPDQEKAMDELTLLRELAPQAAEGRPR